MNILSIRKTLIVALILITLMPLHLTAQHLLRGIVTNAESMLPIEGVNVFFPESGKGTITDEEGLFTLEAHESDKEIYFSYVGFQTKKIKITDSDNLEIELIPQINLEEVVIDCHQGRR